jgi:hypothetical protein
LTASVREVPIRAGASTLRPYNRTVRRDISRTLLVVAEQPQLWAAIRDRLDPALALVRSTRPSGLAEVWARADPWPWLVVGATREVPEALPSLVAGRPIPVLWLRRPAGTLPPASAVHATWSGLAARLDGLAGACVFGLRFAPRRGIRTEDRHHIAQAPELEGLMAAHPGALPLFEDVRRARRTIARHSLPCRLAADAQTVRLEAAATT